MDARQQYAPRAVSRDAGEHLWPCRLAHGVGAGALPGARVRRRCWQGPGAGRRVAAARGAARPMGPPSGLVRRARGGRVRPTRQGRCGPRQGGRRRAGHPNGHPPRLPRARHGPWRAVCRREGAAVAGRSVDRGAGRRWGPPRSPAMPSPRAGAVAASRDVVVVPAGGGELQATSPGLRSGGEASRRGRGGVRGPARPVVWACGLGVRPTAPVTPGAWHHRGLLPGGGAPSAETPSRCAGPGQPARQTGGHAEGVGSCPCGP